MDSWRFATNIGAISVTASVILAAALVNRFVPQKRRHIRSTAILGLLYLLAFGAMHALMFAGRPEEAVVAGYVAEFFGAITAVNLTALVAFDLVLTAVRIEPAPLLTDIVVGVGYLAAALITFARAGVQLTGVLAISTLVTTITAFSLQGTLANVVGGLALQIDRGIKVGDWVQLENGRQGKVREIRWRFTVIETRDWDTMVVPNATILSTVVTILGKRDGAPLQHRMWVYFNVDYRHSPSIVIQTINDALQAAPIEGVALDPKAHCICMDLARDGKEPFASYAVRYWLTDLAKDDPTSSRVRERIFTALKRAQIPLAVPASHLWLENDDVAHQERKQTRELARRLEALGQVGFLKPLRDEERAHLAQRLKYAVFAPGECVTRQGAVAHWLYIVISGKAEVRVAVDGVDEKVAVIEAPDFVGERGLMTGEPRGATVVASVQVECYRLDKAAFVQIMNERPEIAAEVTPLLAQRKVELDIIRKHLDADASRRALAVEHSELLGKIERFFGLEREPRSVAS